MELQKDDWVRTETGLVGKVALVSRLTVFVEIDAGEDGSSMGTFLLSQVTRIDPPTESNGSN
jgi:hypothetical protein